MKFYTSDKEAVEDLLITLRSIGASYSQVELSLQTIKYIDRAKEINQILKEGQVDFKQDLDELSLLCNWNMAEFLNQVLHYPPIIPRVRRLDGKLHYEFPEPFKPMPMDKVVKEKLVRLANRITTEEKRNELIDLIEEEQHLLYVTNELLQSTDLSFQEREDARELFKYFW